MNDRNENTEQPGGALSQERFDALAAAYGADPERWPPGERAAARLRLQQDAAAEAIRAAAALDRLLDLLPAPAPPDPHLRRRILAAAPTPRSGLAAWLGALWRELGGARRAGPAFALSLVLGVLLAPLAASTADDEAELALQAIVLDEDLEELLP